MCLAQGHNTVTPVRLEPAASRSRVKHSTTEPCAPALKAESTTLNQCVPKYIGSTMCAKQLWLLLKG